MQFRTSSRPKRRPGVLASIVVALGAVTSLPAGCGTAEPPAPPDQTPIGPTGRFDIENRPLTDFLQWVAGRTGRELRFSSNGARITAGKIILHGSINGLPPDVALLAVMATTDLSLATRPGLILIGPPTESHRSAD